MSTANSARNVIRQRRPLPIVSQIAAFYRWNRLLFRWAGIVVRPVLPLFATAAVGELLISLGRVYQAALISSVPRWLAASGTSGGAGGTGFLGMILPRDPRAGVFLLLGVIVFMALFQFLFRAMDALAGSRMMAALQAMLHDRLIGLGTRWHDREGHDAGANMQIVNLAPAVQQALALVVKSPLIQGVSVVTSALFIFQGLAQLPQTPLWIEIVGVVLLLGLPLLAWQLSRPVRRANEAVLSAQKNFSTELLNSLSQPLAIQTLGGVRQRSASMRQRLQALASARFRTAVRGEAAEEFKSALPYLLQALFLLYAVFATVGAGRTTGASLVGSLQAILLILQLVPQAVLALLSIIDILTGINEQWPMIAGVGEILDMDPREDAPDATDWPAESSGVELRKVVFSYGPALPLLLDGIEYTFAPGVITAIAGLSGSGKSTLFQLLTRLRRPVAGTIAVSGTDLALIRLDEVRRHIGIVHQSPPFLTATVRANFQLVAIDASDGEIEAACRKVGVWDVLAAKNPAAPLDQPMTREGGGANDFSGGERRRLAIARGLLNHPSVLLFDEPTAGIDAQALERVAEAIRRASAGVISIVIDHNLDFVLGLADTVCVLAGGRFVQTGNPRQLAEQPGPLRDLLEAARRLAGDAAMTVTSYPMPVRSAAGAPQIGPISPMPMAGLPDPSSILEPILEPGSGMPPLGRYPDRDAGTG